MVADAAAVATIAMAVATIIIALATFAMAVATVTGSYEILVNGIFPTWQGGPP